MVVVLSVMSVVYIVVVMTVLVVVTVVTSSEGCGNSNGTSTTKRFTSWQHPMSEQDL